MKKAKQWLSVILSIVVVFTMALTPAMAAGTDNGSVATITVETVQKEVKAGDEVTLNVSITGNPGFAGLDFTIVYDGNKLALTDITKEELLSQGLFTPNPDKNKVTFANTSILSGDGTLFALKFTAKVASDNAKVEIVNNGFTGIRNDEIQVTIVPGGVVAGTTGGSTTGGSTTGGSTTGGSTTGGSTTGGSTTGGGTTGGGSTGGGSSSGSGSGSSYTSGMSFTTDLPADSITRVTVNGKKLDSKYYTISSNGSGSIVTLTDAYLATLKAGTYTIKIENATHVSTGTFTIKADGTPKTADAGIALYAVMAVSSLMGTAVVSKKCRKA